MAYDASTGIITAPVSIDDIKQCFQVLLQKTVSGTTTQGYSCDLGTIIGANTGDTVDGLSVASRRDINMWAKFKPVRVMKRDSVPSGVTTPPQGFSDTNTIPNAAPYQRVSGAWNLNATFQWWRDTKSIFYLGSYRRTVYGIMPGIPTGSLATLFSQYNEWTYFKPTTLEPQDPQYRFIDFDEYNQNAPEPLGSIYAPTSLILTTGEAWSIDVSMIKNQDDAQPINDRDYITPEDILTTLWGACYFGFALIDSNGTPKIWVTGNRYYGIGSNGGKLAAGNTYTIMPFYTNLQLPQQESSGNLNPPPADITSSSQFVTIPNIQMPQLVVASSTVQQDDARFSVKAILNNGRLTVQALVDARPMSVTGGTIRFNGGYYKTVTIYVCVAGTTVGAGEPNPSQIITSRTFYNANNMLHVLSGSYAEVGGQDQIFTGISAEKCRVYVYAGNGSQSDNTVSARAMGDAMVSSIENTPTVQ